MTTFNELSPDSLVSGNQAIQSFKRNGVHIPHQGVEEYLVIETTEILVGSTKKIAHDRYQLLPISMWVDVANTNQGDCVLRINYKGSELYRFNLTYTMLPFTFPTIVMNRDIDITITPSFAIDRAIVVCKQIYEVERIVL